MPTIAIRRADGEKAGRWEKAHLKNYAAESELLSLLSKDPDLIPFDDLEDPRGNHRVPITEMSLPNAGSLDLLIIDEKGIISIVETKLARNREARRRVLAQILDYASDLWGMSYEELDERVSRARDGRHLHDLVQEASKQTADEWDEEGFKKNVASRLEKGSFDLFIAVDKLSEDLRRIVRYLNRSREVAVYPLEVRYYKSGGYEAVAPRIFDLGVIEQPELPWDWERFSERLDPNDLNVYMEIKEFAEEEGSIQWGKGRKVPTFAFTITLGGKELQAFSAEATGIIGVIIKPFRESLHEGELDAIIAELRKIPSLSRVDRQTSWKYFKAKEIKEPERMENFKKAVLAMKQAVEKAG